VQEVLRYIEERTAQQESGPFIAWLSDDSVPARDRLMRWLPCAAPWIFGFMDLNGILLKYPDDDARRDRYKQAINDHLEEDAQHWTFYLEDLRGLGLDASLDFPEVLRFLWGSETRTQRLAVYRLSVLAARSEDPILRYCLIAALESFAHLLFATLHRVSVQFDRETGRDLLYVGSVHAAKEPGGLANQTDAIEAEMQAEVLDRRRRSEGLDIVRQVCDVIDERWVDLHRCGQSDTYRTFLRSA
jgi:hypothetical protein